MIKKSLMVAAMAGCVAAGAQANILLDLGTTEGFFMGPTDGGGLLGTGDSALIQLWLAADGVIDGGGDGAQAGVGAAAAVAGGNDVWLMDFVFTEGVTPSAFPAYAYIDAGDFPTPGGGNPTMFDDGGANTLNVGTSVVYGRIFQDENPQVGDWYFVTDGLVIQDLDPNGVPAPSPDVLDLNSGGAGSGLGDSLSHTAGHSFQVVPEPGTIALFGLGILTLLGRRKRS